MPPTTNSDSEDDFDYVPPVDDQDSDSGEGQGDVAAIAERATPQADPDEQKKQRDALWASFQASVSDSSTNGITTAATASAATRIQIEKTYLFAGKHVTEVVDVLEDSEEARKWPRWSPRACPTPDAASAPPSDDPKKEGTALSGGGGDDDDDDDGSTSPPVVDPNPALPTTAGAKRLGPRKPRTALPSIPKASQAKKITTLDKSAMDWRAHLTSQSGDVQDELDANRRGGGYLEKVDFLKRVEERREDVFEASKASKRRKT